MDETEKVIDDIRKFTELREDNVVSHIRKTSAIRLINYIDKLEDENFLLKSTLSKNIVININK